MSKIALNFFGEKYNIDRPESLLALKTQIAHIFCFSFEDACEILLTYKDKGDNKVLISNDQDLKIFLDSKIDTIYLDISQESKLYKKNLIQLTEESLNKQIELLLKKKDELEKIKNEKIKSEKEKMEEIQEKIRKLYLEKGKIKTEYRNEIKKIKNEQFEIEKKIFEIQQKLAPPHKEPIQKFQKNNNPFIKCKQFPEKCHYDRLCKECGKLIHVEPIVNIPKLQEDLLGIPKNYKIDNNNIDMDFEFENNEQQFNYDNKIVGNCWSIPKNGFININQKPMNNGPEEYKPFVEWREKRLQPTNKCTHCGRKFNEFSYFKHVQICENASKKKREIFNAKKQRIDHEQAYFMKKGALKANLKPKLNKKKYEIPKWKIQSVEFREMCNQNSKLSKNKY